MDFRENFLTWRAIPLINFFDVGGGGEFTTGIVI